MKRTFKKLLTVGIFLSIGGLAFAGDGDRTGSNLGSYSSYNSETGSATGSGSARTFQLRKHEFAVGGSFYPGHGMIFWGGVDDTDELSYDNAWWVSYTYNFTKVFALGFSVTYDGFTSQSYDYASNTTFPKRHEYYITPMLTARFSWLNRPIVRLYSSAGIGLAINSDGWYNNSRFCRCRFGWQATPIGISIGKKLFGYAELGIGTIYNIGSAGIGYRF